ncbi:MAG: carboxypeptidase-like regulatory domain-containing protein [Terracidiphilus sp.]|jgi:tetratricopeptide (TPR) repeat protein
MKRTFSLRVGLPAAAALLALAFLPALAQAAESKPTGKIHGHLTNPAGASVTTGTVSLSLDGGVTAKYTFEVSASGDYAGEAPPDTYTVFYRAPETPKNQAVDSFQNVKIVAGQDTVQDFDMSRKEFIDKMSPEQKKQLEEIKKHNAAALKANEVIKGLNADIKAAAQDFHDANATQAHPAALQALGASASKEDLAAKEDAIKTEKFSAVETMMLKDTAAKADASILWMDLAQAQAGLKKYDLAAANYQKALDVEAAASKANPEVQGAAHAGLGEIYARTGKIPEANAAYDAAAKVYPTNAGVYFKNEAVIFYQTQKPDAQTAQAAQAAAADEAIKADPNMALAYYLKGNGLIANTTMDAKTQKLVAPPGCMEAYQKYLELAPDGPYAAEVKGILDSFGQKISSSYKAGKK